MKTVKEKTHKKKIVRWPKLLCICAVLFTMFHIGQQFMLYQDIQEEVDYYQAQLQEAEAAYLEKQAQLQLLSNDSYLEQLARTSLGMVKDGEIIVSPADVSDVVPEYDENGKEIIH